ncbi:ABC transporter ATP-binding protein [Pontibacter anaerobius]|uniref:ABC transporter ATP-binding protein n=1 Tax=Pontibacter anaerobius TaxID=2993940 RepID=A0ABT3RKK4_9BACT|nr:ABC transporter ATP-binding protein [Pontibacter anaerobius]MCX2742095.1 ABC transporter ATP-binding protein [Pontibacter anaerobius]
MRKSKYVFGITWLVLLLALPFTQAFAQDASDTTYTTDIAQQRIIKLHPLQIGEVYFSYEKMRTERISNEFGISYVYRGYFKSDDFLPDDVKAGGVHMRMSQRYYTSKKHDGVPLGFFHGPLFGYRFMVFEEGVFNTAFEDPGSSTVGRLYQNSLELNYQLGSQFMLGKGFTMEVSAALGARLKVAMAKGADDLLTENIIGHALVAERNSAIFIVPSPQLNISAGYSF